ncbi:MAG: malto-oligosyltrehalose synthase, partial [Acidobacteriota bacterium]
MYRVPTATYRLQFHAQFTFRDALRITPYLHELGISDLYASPLLRARSGSTHGYDIVDANALSPDLGTEADLDELHAELQRRGMGVLLDIVPNHMAASHENAWWVSVLENGPQSRFLHYFDIDWRNDKVLLPVLGRPYGEALEAGELRLDFDGEGFFLTYYDKRYPLAPHSYRLILEWCTSALPAEGEGIELHDLVQNETVIANSRFLKDTISRLRDQSPEFRQAMDGAITRFNEDPDLLDRVLEAQWYRLAHWRTASETINYRRFFDVTDLVGLRVENPEVFEMRNRIILDLIGRGVITGLRIDHIDGLHDPVTYLAKLQLRLGDPATDEVEPFYVVVEKILAHGEPLPAAFRCAGTTGYDFLGTSNALFIDPAGLAKLAGHYERFTGITTSYADLMYERKKQVIEQLFSGEMRALGGHLGELAAADRNARDLAPSELLAALMEITACMPVYRTYIREGEVSPADEAVIRKASSEARRRASHVHSRLFRFVELVLLLAPPRYAAGQRDRWLDFVMRWQQFTSRVMAKGVEDTAFYNDHRLISLNEVGGEPGRGVDHDPVAELHARNETIARDWPHTMNATSTHDTKRSEDVRARIHVLSEIPDLWERAVRKWARINAGLKRNGAPDANEELLIYQTLVGVWPLEESEMPTLPQRMHGFLEKAAREAKTHSSWIDPNVEYESALQSFTANVLQHEPFLTPFRRFQRRVAFHGSLNSLTQVVLKTCAPGVPDFYQGSESWDFSLVDPDNRRPVDYERNARLVNNAAAPSELLRQWQDGRVKAFVTVKTLAARARHALADATYQAVDTGTPNAVAFLRGDDLLVVLPRLTTQLVTTPRPPLGHVWGTHALHVPGRWKNVFTGEVPPDLALRNVFATFPVA